MKIRIAFKDGVEGSYESAAEGAISLLDDLNRTKFIILKQKRDNETDKTIVYLNTDDIAAVEVVEL